MLKTEVIHARMQPDLKHAAETILHQVGLSTTDAIELFFHQVVLKRGLPFEVRIPNKVTQKAILDARAGRGMRSHKSVQDMFDTIEAKPTKKRR